MRKLSNKDFYRLTGAYSRFKSEITYAWFDWRRENFDGDWNPKGNYDVTFEWKTREIVAISDAFGEDRFSIDEMIEDEEYKIKVEFNVGWYDGPLCGAGEYNGQKVWYSVFDTTWDNLFNVWTYNIYKLSDAEYEAELEQFNNYDEDYELKGYTDNEYLGRFDDCELDWSEMRDLFHKEDDDEKD